MARYDDLDTSAIAYATFISAVLLVVIVLLVQALTFNWLLGEDERKLAESHYTASDNEIAKQKARLDVLERVNVEVIPPTVDGAAPTTEPAKPIVVERIHVPLRQAQMSILKELSKPAEPAPGT
jgi:hypothetical protein